MDPCGTPVERGRRSDRLVIILKDEMPNRTTRIKFMCTVVLSSFVGLFLSF